MLIPYGTDAPTYHFPFATISVIAINVGAFCATGMGCNGSYHWLILEFDTINPIQWVTAAFMHASWIHLIGNMIFLWCFGLVVEGKLGWYRFGLLYLGLALADGAIGQIPMFILGVGDEFGEFGPSGALGASGVIFALIAVALIWAPENDMHCLFVWSFIYVRTIDVPIFALGMFYFAVEMLHLLIGGFHMSTAMLHLLGMSVGFPFAIYMLRNDLVDCEGWDIFSRYGQIKGSSTSLNPLFLIGSLFRATPVRDNARMLVQGLSSDSGQDALKSIRANPGKFNPPTAEADSLSVAVESLREAIESDNPDVASAIFRNTREHWGTHTLSEATIASYANLMARHRRHLESIEPLQVLVSRRSRHANQACMRIAIIQLRVQRSPAAAVATVRKMVKPWSAELEKKRKEILAAGHSPSLN